MGLKREYLDQFEIGPWLFHGNAFHSPVRVVCLHLGIID